MYSSSKELDELLRCRIVHQSQTFAKPGLLEIENRKFLFPV